MYDLNLKVIKDRPAPARKTQPASNWRDLYGSMKKGHWFEVKCDCGDKVYSRVIASATSYMRGRYSFYQRKDKPGYYVFEVIKG